jgi:hypothetical protein
MTPPGPASGRPEDMLRAKRNHLVSVALCGPRFVLRVKHFDLPAGTHVVREPRCFRDVPPLSRGRWQYLVGSTPRRGLESEIESWFNVAAA